MKASILIVVALLVVLVLAAPAAAQTGALVSGTLEVCPTAGGACLTNTFTLAATQTTCNQPQPVLPVAVFNPVKLAFPDVQNAGRWCVTTMGTWLGALPILTGAYQGTITVTDDRGISSAKSPLSNLFWRGTPTVTVAPTGVMILP